MPPAKLIQETVWLDDLPIATLRPTGATGTPTPINAYYMHADHLGSPRAVTRPSDNAIMWRWDNTDPFGANPANENPAGQGTFKYALRFPGQYFDAETGTHYNYFRDYDPGVGRYEQSDPIGLAGGVNTYKYVMNSPIRYYDPSGLVAEVCSRPVRVPGVPGQHCFIRFNGDNNNTSSYDTGGVHSDPHPQNASCKPVKGPDDDDCVKREMAKCQGSDYDYFKNNCCHCAERALSACRMSFPVRDWPNWPINPGPQPGEPGRPR